jgi:formylglycine-generating enzyme required for sulfatase activity
VRLIAKGGMGAVYEAVDQRSGIRVAVKILRAGVLPEGLETERERFRQEAELIARMDHPNVVRIHAAEHEGETPYLAQDLLPGGSLAERIGRTGQLDVAEAVLIASKLARGLHHAHERGILHRDLKPKNVMFDDRGEPRLVDFGLARDTARERYSLTTSGTIMGTPAFMAPEQARGDRIVDRRTDVYGAGALLYAMLTGADPFAGASMLRVLDAVETESPQPPRELRPDLPRGVEQVCLRAMEKEPGDRYETAAELADALDVSLSRRIRLGSRRQVAVLATALALPAALVLGFAVATSGDSSGASPAVTRPPVAKAPPVVTKDPSPPDDGVPEWVRAADPEHRPRLPLPAGIVWGDGVGELVNERDGSVLVWVPALRFSMGSPPSEQGGGVDERPRHRVRITQGFFIGKYEVTWNQYRVFCADTGVEAPEPLFEVGGDHPVHRVGLQDARDYCRWAGLHLPTEAEWELAAKGPRYRVFPWGNEPPGPDRCNINLPDAFEKTSPVGAFLLDRSPFGCLDMGGNVREWVDDAYRQYTADPQVDPHAEVELMATVRGGGWNLGPHLARSSNRVPSLKSFARGWLGFRVARVFH